MRCIRPGVLRVLTTSGFLVVASVSAAFAGPGATPSPDSRWAFVAPRCAMNADAVVDSVAGAPISLYSWNGKAWEKAEKLVPGLGYAASKTAVLDWSALCKDRFRPGLVDLAFDLRAGWNLIGNPTLNNESVWEIAGKAFATQISLIGERRYFRERLANRRLLSPGETVWAFFEGPHRRVGAERVLTLSFNGSTQSVMEAGAQAGFRARWAFKRNGYVLKYEDLDGRDGSTNLKYTVNDGDIKTIPEWDLTFRPIETGEHRLWIEADGYKSNESVFLTIEMCGQPAILPRHWLSADSSLSKEEYRTVTIGWNDVFYRDFEETWNYEYDIMSAGLYLNGTSSGVLLSALNWLDSVEVGREVELIPVCVRIPGSEEPGFSSAHYEPLKPGGKLEVKVIDWPIKYYGLQPVRTGEFGPVLTHDANGFSSFSFQQAETPPDFNVLQSIRSRKRSENGSAPIDDLNVDWTFSNSLQTMKYEGARMRIVWSRTADSIQLEASPRKVLVGETVSLTLSKEFQCYLDDLYWGYFYGDDWYGNLTSFFWKQNDLDFYQVEPADSARVEDGAFVASQPGRYVVSANLEGQEIQPVEIEVLDPQKPDTFILSVENNGAVSANTFKPANRIICEVGKEACDRGWYAALGPAGKLSVSGEVNLTDRFATMELDEKDLKFVVLNPEIVQVSEDGVWTGLKAGDAEFYIEHQGSVSPRIQLSVKPEGYFLANPILLGGDKTPVTKFKKGATFDTFVLTGEFLPGKTERGVELPVWTVHGNKQVEWGYDKGVLEKTPSIWGRSCKFGFDQDGELYVSDGYSEWNEADPIEEYWYWPVIAWTQGRCDFWSAAGVGTTDLEVLGAALEEGEDPRLKVEVWDEREWSVCAEGGTAVATYRYDYRCADAEVKIQGDCESYNRGSEARFNFLVDVSDDRRFGNVEVCYDLEIYNADGKLVRTLRNEGCEEGPILGRAAAKVARPVVYQNISSWDFTDENGVAAPDGDYSAYARFYVESQVSCDPIINVGFKVTGGEK